MIKTEVDEDGSGEIDFQEFLEIMNCKTLRFVEKKHHNSRYRTQKKYREYSYFTDECRLLMTGNPGLGILSNDLRMKLAKYQRNLLLIF